MLIDFWIRFPDATSELKAWYAEVKYADWDTPAEVKMKYGNASILKNGRVIFNICGNKYRLIVKVNYAFHMVYIRFVGTHADYDKINVHSI